MYHIIAGVGTVCVQLCPLPPLKQTILQSCMSDEWLGLTWTWTLFPVALEPYLLSSTRHILKHIIDAHIVLYDVVVVAGEACPEAEVGVEAAVLWQVLPLVEAQVPLADGPRRVAQLTQVLRQQAMSQRQSVRFSCQNRYSLHACGQSQFCLTITTGKLSAKEYKDWLTPTMLHPLHHSLRRCDVTMLIGCYYAKTSSQMHSLLSVSLQIIYTANVCVYISNFE